MSRRPGSAPACSGTLARLAALALACGVLAGCGGGPDFLEPGLGDFVQSVEPADGEVVSADKLERRAVSVVLNFLPAEGQFGFGSLQSFRFDGDEVSDEVAQFPTGGPPARSVILTFRPDAEDIREGEHTVEMVYADSRGTLHRIRWSFRVEGAVG